MVCTKAGRIDNSLRRRREFGHRLGTFTDGVLGEFTRKHETDSGLNLARAERRLFVVRGELSSFSGDALKDIVDKGVHNRHALLGDTSIGVDLLQHLVDVRAVGFGALLRLGLAGGSLLGGFRRLLGRSLGHGSDL